MRDRNFLIENNAKPIWHPMAHPAEMRAQPPRIIMKGEGIFVTDIEGRTVLDSVGGLWNVNLGFSLRSDQESDCRPARRTSILLRLPRHLDRPIDRAGL
jgi:adenosylmethionine-8-amino-7-oxononanoate aminotransferase